MGMKTFSNSPFSIIHQHLTIWNIVTSCKLQIVISFISFISFKLFITTFCPHSDYHHAISYSFRHFFNSCDHASCFDANMLIYEPSKNDENEKTCCHRSRDESNQEKEDDNSNPNSNSVSFDYLI